MKLPLLAGFCVALTLSGCSGSAPSAEKPATSTVAIEKPAETSAEKLDYKTFVGKPVPAFEFVFADGSQMKSEELKGQVLLLDFWATWCVTCKAASPIVQKWHEAYGKQNFTAIGVNTFESTDPNADKNKKIVLSAEASNAYAKEHNYTFTFATYGDPTAERWGIGGVPTFILIGKDGVVLNVETNTKPETMAKLEAAIKKAVGA